MAMKQLSSLDASFLYLETPEMPMHVGALHILERPAASKGRFVNVLRQHMAQRLPAAPALRRKLWRMPLNLANPAWVDAVPDLKHHIVEAKLPKGAGLHELEALVGELHTQLLDRSKPLWRFHVIEGLAPGEGGRKRVGLYSQLHHAGVDGQAAVALANVILDLTPEPRTIESRPSGRTRQFSLGLVEMISGAVSNEVQQLTHIIRSLPATVGSLSSAATQAASRSELVSGKKRAGALALAPRTRLNASVTAGRAFATQTLPLHELKALGRLHGATLNDMVLMLCSTALRRFFGKHGPLPRKSLIAAMPISLREAGDTRSDNQASMTLVSLGTNIADPSRRLAHIKAATRSLKRTLADVKSLLPTDIPSIGVPWLVGAAGALYGRAKVADRLPPLANVTISNVPGPPVPLYMAGARMLTNYPCSIVVHGVGLNITVQSYDQSLDFGLMADKAAMPEVRELADAIAVAFDDLRALPEDETAPSRATVRDVAQGAARTAARSAGNVIRRAADVAGAALSGTGRQIARKAVGGVLDSATGSVKRKR